MRPQRPECRRFSSLEVSHPGRRDTDNVADRGTSSRPTKPALPLPPPARGPARVPLCRASGRDRSSGAWGLPTRLRFRKGNECMDHEQARGPGWALVAADSSPMRRRRSDPGGEPRLAWAPRGRWNRQVAGDNLGRGAGVGPVLVGLGRRSEPKAPARSGVSGALTRSASSNRTGPTPCATRFRSVWMIGAAWERTRPAPGPARGCSPSVPIEPHPMLLPSWQDFCAAPPAPLISSHDRSETA